MPSEPRDRIALTIGVTGQRDVPPECEPPLRAAFATILDDLAAACPHTPLTLLATLAPGAETIAVAFAAERGIPIVACLPAPPDACRAALPAAERPRFDAALAACARVETVTDAEAEDARLREAGMYVAHYCHLLVAFWDGAPDPSDGALAEVVDARLLGTIGDGAVPSNLPGLPDLGPVHRIITPRPGTPPSPEPATATTYFPRRFTGDAEFQRDFDEALHRLDQCNLDLARLAGEPAGAETIERLRDRIGDAASALQRTTFRFLYALYVTAVVATAAQYTSILAFKFAMFPLAFAAYRIAKRYDYENRYQDYRALSEGLRVQAAWFGAGLRDEQADRCYLGMQERELQWIRMALRYTHFAFRPAAAGGRIGDGACRDWIEGQWRYFKDKPRIEERWLRRLENASRATFWTALAVAAFLFTYLDLPPAPHAVAHALAALATNAHVPAALASWSAATAATVAKTNVGWSPPAPGPLHAWLERLSTGVLALYAAVALLIANYGEKRGFALNVKRYDRMFAVFDRAKRRLDAMPDPESPAGREIVRELGRAALIENGDWLLTRREHPLAFVN